MRPLRDAKAGELCGRVPSTWLQEQLERLDPALDRNAFASAFSAAGRKVGESQADLARAALLLEAVACVPPDEQPPFVEDVFSTGNNREREALLRVLSFLPGPARFVSVALAACRTNVQSVFEAIGCENPFPADHFPEAGFNHLVLKALFLGVPVARIVGLERRANPELTRMVGAFRSERLAAGRSVPGDVAILIGEPLRGENDE